MPKPSSKPSNPFAAGVIRLRNNGRDTVLLRFKCDPTLLTDAVRKKYPHLGFDVPIGNKAVGPGWGTIRVGSEDDRNVLADGELALQPEVEIPVPVWAEALRNPVIEGMVHPSEGVPKLSIY